MEKWVQLARLVIDRKMGKTSKGRGLSEKLVKRVRAGDDLKDGRKMVKIKMPLYRPENVIQ